MATILIVEGDPTFQNVLTNVLQLEGYDVLTAAQSYAGLAQLQHPVDLILCDVQMPGLDGVAFYQRLRADPAYHALPVILMSARAPHSLTLDLHTTFLAKPLNPATLLATIARMFNQKHQGSEGA